MCQPNQKVFYCAWVYLRKRIFNKSYNFTLDYLYRIKVDF